MKHLILLTIPVLALTACGGGSTSQNASESQTLMLECVKKAGITGQFTSSYTFADGVERRVIKVGNGVSQAQADAANACIAAS
ncbi:MAG: hypothetical protein AAF718_08835 [Pseudomonadota bacterium]